uniref:Uncharacterized protein n=1 Tax=Anguilla anguilla TaxID=7936 RepID=A0A0E9T3S3_ANGAN
MGFRWTHIQNIFMLQSSSFAIFFVISVLLENYS